MRRNASNPIERTDMLVPRQAAPELTVDTLAHGRFDLAREEPQRMTLVCFYRGLHCPVCANYLKELDRLTPAFLERGVTTIAISSDGEARARCDVSIGCSPGRVWETGVTTLQDSQRNSPG
jgi:hypothetical protein